MVVFRWFSRSWTLLFLEPLLLTRKLLRIVIHDEKDTVRHSSIHLTLWLVFHRHFSVLRLVLMTFEVPRLFCFGPQVRCVSSFPRPFMGSVGWSCNLLDARFPFLLNLLVVLFEFWSQVGGVLTIIPWERMTLTDDLSLTKTVASTRVGL